MVYHHRLYRDAFILFPNGQNLRPAEFTDPNIFTWLVGRLYHADTNTNVIPSMHVLGCMAAVFGLFRCCCTPRWVKIGVIILTVLINASTVFIKQHSILDVIIALIVSVVLYFVVFRWMDKRIGGCQDLIPQNKREPPLTFRSGEVFVYLFVLGQPVHTADVYSKKPS